MTYESLLNPIVLIIVGVLFLLFGYKIQKIIIALSWFIIGFLLAGMVAKLFVDASSVLLVVQIIVGIIFALLGFKLEKLAIYLAVAFYSYKFIGPYITFFNEKLLNLVVAVVISLMIGAISTKAIRPIFIIITCLFGTSLIMNNIGNYITLTKNISLIVSIVLVLIGLVSQFKTNKS